VGNVDEGCLESLVELCKLASHRCTELSVQVGERFVEQEYLRFTDDCTTKCDTLLLTAGKSFGTSVQEVRDIKNSCGFFNAALDFFLSYLAELKTE